MKKIDIRFIDSGYNNGYLNMAIDEILSLKLMKKETLPILRFYQWNPPCLSLGYFQDPLKEVDFEGLKKHGVTLVRRLTGGRAVLHDIEITYSIIIPSNVEWISSSITESYKFISIALLNGLKNLGIKADLSKPQNIKNTFKTSACFDSTSSYELAVNGKKIIGSAQRRFNGILLQHGSIPIKLNEDKLFDLLKIEPIERKNSLKNYFKEKATSLEDELKYIPEIGKIKKAFFEGFKESLPINIIDDKLTNNEIKESQELSNIKYSTDEWNIVRKKL